MPLYCFFGFIPTTKFHRDVLYVSYYDDLKAWMMYCECWEYKGMLKWLLFPIPLILLLNDISEDVTLVQLMDSLVNMNHAISILGYWIFDSNNKKTLFKRQESLDIICSTSID